MRVEILPKIVLKSKSPTVCVIKRLGICLYFLLFRIFFAVSALAFTDDETRGRAL